MRKEFGSFRSVGILSRKSPDNFMRSATRKTEVRRVPRVMQQPQRVTAEFNHAVGGRMQDEKKFTQPTVRSGEDSSKEVTVFRGSTARAESTVSELRTDQSRNKDVQVNTSQPSVSPPPNINPEVLDLLLENKEEKKKRLKLQQIQAGSRIGA